MRRLNASEWTEWKTFSDDDTVISKAQQYVDQEYATIVLGNNGWGDLADTTEGIPDVAVNMILTQIINWSSTGAVPYSLCGKYIIGAPNSTLNGVKVRFWYK